MGKRKAKAKASLRILIVNEKSLENLTAKGRGRPKGSPNKVSKTLKDMILEALDKAGGVDYLVQRAQENDGAFLTLVGKVLPMDIQADISATVISKIERRIVKPNEKTED